MVFIAKTDQPVREKGQAEVLGLILLAFPPNLSLFSYTASGWPRFELGKGERFVHKAPWSSPTSRAAFLKRQQGQKWACDTGVPGLQGGASPSLKPGSSWGRGGEIKA